jgi:N-acetylneuraminic acid mutarotase
MYFMKKTSAIIAFTIFIFTFLNAQTWTSATLSQARADCAIGVIDKKLIIAGGGTDYLNLTLGKSSKVDIYDDVTQKWTTATLSSARYNPSSAVVGKKMYVLGGQEGDSNLPSNKYDVYDAEKNTWVSDTLPYRPFNTCVAAANNKILFAGGETPVNNTNIFLNKVRLWDVSTNKWTIDTLSVGRGLITSVNLGSKTFFIGGLEVIDFPGGRDNKYSDAIDIYDAATNVWTKAKLSSPRFFPMVTVVGKKILIVGGIEGYLNQGTAIFSKKIDIYDSETNKWTTSESPEPRGGSGAITWENNAYYVWGRSSNSSASFDYAKINIYNPSNNSWKELATPNTVSPRGAQVAAINNKLFIIGGINSTFIPSNKIDIVTLPISSTNDLNLNALELSTFPNPTNSKVNLKFKSNAQTIGKVSILNLNGQILKSENRTIFNGENLIDIDCNDIPNGVYFVTIKSDKNLGTSLFVKN